MTTETGQMEHVMGIIYPICSVMFYGDGLRRRLNAVKLIGRQCSHYTAIGRRLHHLETGVYF